MKLRAWFRRKGQFEAEMGEELCFHLEQQIAANIAAGMAPEEARRQARLQLGAVEGVKAECREERRGFWLESLWSDLRYGARMLRKNPGFTAIVVITLGFGIGANTAIFSVVNSILLRPLPAKDPGEIVDLAWQQKNSKPVEYFSYADYKDIREQSSSVFSNVAIFRTNFDGLSTKGRADRILTSYVSGNYFPMLGLKPAEGRLIEPSDGGPVSPDSVIVLSYAYWQGELGGAKDVLGKTVELDGEPMEVIGITPRGFHGTMPFVETQAYLPFAASGEVLTNRAWRNLHVLARRKDAVTIANADSALRVVAQRLALQDPKDDKDMAVSAYPENTAQLFGPSADGPLKIVSGLFLALAGMVLLLACINVASVLLARTTARRREMALRAALGGTRTRLIRQLLTESLLLACFGGLAGIFAGVWSSVALSSMPLNYGVPLLLDFGFDWRVFLYGFTATIAAGIVGGMVPALRASRHNVDAVLHETESNAVSGRQRVRSALVVAQVAGSLMLLVIAGLFLRSLQRAQHIDLGFNVNHLLNLSMDPHEIGYNDAQSQEFYKELLRRVRIAPGVQSATLAYTIPMRPYTMNADYVDVPGYTRPAGQPTSIVYFNMVTPGYFATIGTPLVRGREFTAADDKGEPEVAIVNQAMAEKFWRGEDPIGRTFQLNVSKHFVRVVGVAKDSKTLHLSATTIPYFYVPLAQFFSSYQTLQVRTVGDPHAMIPGIEHLIASMAPGLPVFDVGTMREALATGLIVFQFGAVLAAALGVLGLMLALVGVYGVTSYAAAQRTHEIGIRLALGAQPGKILRMMLRQGAFVIGIGMCIGVLCALAAGRVAGRFLLVSGTDRLTYVTVSVVLALVALAACWIPARRAMRVDPMRALRRE